MTEAETRSVGLVLSGGGTRLFAHIGFLWALDDAGLLDPRSSPLRAVVGNSAGSLVGSMLALGYSPREIWKVANWHIWGYVPPQEPRSWRGDARPRGLEIAVELDFDGLARALTHHLSHFKGIDSGRRFEALLRRVLEREGPGGLANPGFQGTRPPEAALPLYLIGHNLTNRRQTIFQYLSHCPGARPLSLGACQVPLGREASYEVCCDCDEASSPKELFRPWEGVRISTSLPLIFRPYYKPRFVATHWDERGQPYHLVQGAYLSDGGSRDNYSLSAAIKLAGCDAVMGCYLGDPGYPYECLGHGTALDVAMRNIDGMMAAIYEADQDDAEIIARPVRTVIPEIHSRPGVTFDLSQNGLVMEAGYIAAAYALRRLRPDIADDRDFLAALVGGGIHLGWPEVFAPEEKVWGPTAAGRVSLRVAGREPLARASNYYVIRPPAEFQALAARFFAEQFPAAAALAAAPRAELEEEIARRNRERREVAPEELDEPPFRDAPLARTQRVVVAWGECFIWAGLSGVIAVLGSVILAICALAGSALGVLPALTPAEVWAAQLGILVAAAGLGWLGRRLAVRYAWRELQRLISRRVGF